MGQPGRGGNSGSALKANRAGRPNHGLNPSTCERITRDAEQPHNFSWQYWGGYYAESGGNWAKVNAMPVIS
jgi:hypothetical protein